MEITSRVADEAGSGDAPRVTGSPVDICGRTNMTAACVSVPPKFFIRVSAYSALIREILRLSISQPPQEGIPSLPALRSARNAAFRRRTCLLNQTMSGFEIAGIVLGAFPIALELLDKYQEVAKRMGLWRHIGEHHNHCKTKLAVQKLQYSHNLKKLLLPMESMDEHAIAKLMENPKGDGWKEGTTADQLEKRLGASYDPYISIMEMFDKSLSKVSKQLALDMAELGERMDANVCFHRYAQNQYA